MGAFILVYFLAQEANFFFSVFNCKPPNNFGNRDLFDQPDQEMAHAISVTPAEGEAIERVCLLSVNMHSHCINYCVFNI